MGQPVEQIVRRKLSDEVFDRLERLITSGELRPGDEMPSERTLMERFGVGRPAIREAMQTLANMGLVNISHGERAKVLELTAKSIFRQVDLTAKIMLSQSPASLEHLKSARIFFERGMTREAAAHATEKDIADLREIIELQRTWLGHPEEFISADMQFHTRIAQISGNPIFVALSEAMLIWLKAYQTDMLIWTGNEDFTLIEHEEILQRLAENDADGAEREMLKHLERSRAFYTK
ncbi:transcriptional regulator NanR [Rhizobium miluonense]|uniref:DNA-binding transcriptional regulator, FadR family n=1 Tax=Rhizobium miluonense TaxID=411945 RepID=A0A1C3VFT4_9HYPH|nr:transcriptional regulator NanR [Rhizobium miluonense]SCB26660.1 DNA-binding transcriptional regulator, FadR family [Rhizobium miluonense]